jgi:hypothetical protein
VPADFIVTPERVIDCRPRRGPRQAAGICWGDPTEEKIAAIPLPHYNGTTWSVSSSLDPGQLSGLPQTRCQR